MGMMAHGRSEYDLYDPCRMVKRVCNYRMNKKNEKCLTSQETIATTSVLKFWFVSGCQHPNLDFEI